MINIFEALIISNSSYAIPHMLHKNKGYIDAYKWNFSFKQASGITDGKDGFFAVAFEREHQMIIGVKGTNSDFIENLDWKNNLEQISADFQNNLKIITKQIPPQYFSLKNFVSKIIHDYPDKEIILSGHSLGGALVQLLSIEYGYKAFAFDPPGIAGIAYNHFNINNKDINKNIKIFVSNPNHINTAGKHITNPDWIKISLTEEYTPDYIGYSLYSKHTHMIETIAGSYNTITGNLQTKIEATYYWPSNIYEGYQYFLSYRLNTDYWNHYMFKRYAENPYLKNKKYLFSITTEQKLQDRFENFEEYKDFFIENHLNTEILPLLTTKENTKHSRTTNQIIGDSTSNILNIINKKLINNETPANNQDIGSDIYELLETVFDVVNLFTNIDKINIIGDNNEY